MLANFVRNASAGHLQSLADEEAVAHETLWPQRGVQALDNFARCAEAGSVHKLQDKENVMAEAHRQVCLILAARAFRRKDANNLTHVWKQLVHGTLPSVLTRIAIESCVKLPSARWFCYRQTSVCAALSLTMQTILKEDPEAVYYLYTDPSVQDHTNWSLTVLERVPGGKLLELFSLAKWLASSADRFAELTQQSGAGPRDIDAIPDDVNIDTRMALVRERCQAGKAIQACIHLHRLPPQSVSNAEDVRGKVKAVCAAVQLQAHGLGREIFGRVRSVTVDRGVEYKLCSTLGTLEHYIPAWHSRRELTVDDEEVPGGTGNVATFNLSARSLPEERLLIPHALVMPGLSHATHKVECGMDSVLEHWKQWLPKFRDVARILTRRDLTEHFLQTCFGLSRQCNSGWKFPEHASLQVCARPDMPHSPSSSQARAPASLIGAGAF
jgi:hypothetical protein